MYKALMIEDHKEVRDFASSFDKSNICNTKSLITAISLLITSIYLAFLSSSSTFSNKSIFPLIMERGVLIVGDRKRIEMVIQNYLSNAIKHAFINSTIKIKIKENEFSIENKGKQIDENRMDTIWESFVSDDQKGTGLGLAIVRNILELHEMSYGVYNLQGGVEFYFRWKK